MTNSDSETAPGTLVDFFPTFGFREADGEEWVLPLHGCIYDPERTSRVRRASLALFRRYLRFKTREDLTPLFRDRARAFFAGHERRKQVVAHCGGTQVVLERPGPEGHVQGTIRLTDAAVHSLRAAQPGHDDWLPFHALLDNDDRQRFEGRVQLLPDTGVSVISDIDDTIKHSEVGNRRELLANTFLRDFRAVPRAALVYQAWAAAGARFHYVSSSPWQLFRPLADFLAADGFPLGTFHLRLFRLRDSRPFKRAVARPQGKLAAIENIVRSLPRRHFVLVGDSGERDPEIYGEIARHFPNQILQILIRDLSPEGPDDSRIRSAFSGLPPELWTLYREVEELREFAGRWTGNQFARS